METERDGEGHVAASAETGDGEVVHVDAELVGVFCQVEEGFDAVFDAHREGVLGSKTVVDADYYGADLGDDGVTPAGIITRIADGEAAAVEVDDDGVFLAGSASSPGLRTVEVETEGARVAGEVAGDGAAEGVGWWSRRSETVDHHSYLHEVAPHGCLGVEEPFWAVLGLVFGCEFGFGEGEGAAACGAGGGGWLHFGFESENEEER